MIGALIGIAARRAVAGAGFGAGMTATNRVMNNRVTPLWQGAVGDTVLVLMSVHTHGRQSYALHVVHGGVSHPAGSCRNCPPSWGDDCLGRNTVQTTIPDNWPAYCRVQYNAPAYCPQRGTKEWCTVWPAATGCSVDGRWTGAPPTTTTMPPYPLTAPTTTVPPTLVATTAPSDLCQQSPVRAWCYTPQETP
jgi:hypothetical protein